MGNDTVEGWYLQARSGSETSPFKTMRTLKGLKGRGTKRAPPRDVVVIHFRGEDFMEPRVRDSSRSLSPKIGVA